MSKSKNSGFYYNEELWNSPAYQALTKNAMNLLHEFATGLRWSWLKSGHRKNKIKVHKNNGEIGYPASAFQNKYNVNKATYQSARNLLIKVGFIRLTHPGGNARGDYAMYKVLIAEDLPINEKRWLRYPEKSWESEIPRKPKNLVGEKTRFGSEKNNTHPKNLGSKTRLLPKKLDT